MQLSTREGGVRAGARSHLRWVSVIVAVLGVVATIWALQPGPQVGLRSAQPDLNAHVGRAPDQVRLEFAQPPVPGAVAEVVVLSPGDKDLARGPATTSAAGVSQAVAGLRKSGAYQVVYEVPLVNGEVARGQYWFRYAPGSGSRWQSPALLGLLIALAAALAAGLLAPGRARTSVVRVPAQRTESPVPTRSAHQVPAQRSRDRHEGVSHPGRARSGPAPAAPADQPTRPVPPREV